MTNRLRLQNITPPKPCVVIYDIEVTPNTFMYSDIDRDSDHINTFIIHPDLNQSKELVEYLSTLSGQIGFNNKKFDSQVQQHFLNNWDWLQFRSAGEIAKFLYEYAQEIIGRQDGFDKFKLDYPEHELSIPQLDLYLIWHFDNIAKKQSLKALQCNLNYPNVQDMPIDHKTYVTKEQLQILVDYNKNDIVSTKNFLLNKKTQGKIQLRKDLQRLYGIPCLNWSDSKIGEELVFKFYCEHTNRDFKEVKKLRTRRDIIYVKDCILPSIEFKTSQFQRLKQIFEALVIHNGYMKKEEKIVVKYKGLEIDYGKGGVHGSLQGIFESDEEWIIYDIDVTSLYPSIAIVNGFYPEHLGPEFGEVYKEKIVDVRIREKKKKKEERNNDIIEALKLSANSVYGKSNSEYSFLYDPKYTLLTTITGQLQLSMLVEDIGENLECTVIQLNTDGVTIKIKRSDIQKFLDICKVWEILTKLELEYVTYEKMYIRDVNNYCAVKSKNEVKLKGCFEIEQDMHKDCSFRIVPIALREYVVSGIPIKDTIRNHDKIWDFLGRVKFKKNMKGVLTSFKDGQLVSETTQKVTRLFVSTNGSPFFKLINDGEKELEDIEFNDEDVRTSSLFKDFLVTQLNIVQDENAKNYPINYRFYEKECEKIIDAVESEYSKVNGKKKKIRDKNQFKFEW